MRRAALPLSLSCGAEKIVTLLDEATGARAGETTGPPATTT